MPERTCAGCGAKKPKDEMIRVCRSAGGDMAVDTAGRAAGRGAYVCPRTECVAEARRRRSLSRVLRAAVPDTLYDDLERMAGE